MNRGTVPPGFTTKAEAWRRMVGGEIAALMRPIPFDGSQACKDILTFTEKDEWPATEADELRGTCAGCAWLERCRDWAIAHERHTFMGGMTPQERQQYRRAFRIQIVDRFCAELYGLASYLPSSLARR